MVEGQHFPFVRGQLAQGVPRCLEKLHVRSTEGLQESENAEVLKQAPQKSLLLIDPTDLPRYRARTDGGI